MGRELNIIINDSRSRGSGPHAGSEHTQGSQEACRHEIRKKKLEKKRQLTVAPGISQPHGGGRGDGAREPEGEAGDTRECPRVAAKVGERAATADAKIRKKGKNKNKNKTKTNSHGGWGITIGWKGWGCPTVATQVAERRGASRRYAVPGGIENKK
jgi:hypothetical protein